MEARRLRRVALILMKKSHFDRTTQYQTRIPFNIFRAFTVRGKERKGVYTY